MGKRPKLSPILLIGIGVAALVLLLFLGRSGRDGTLVVPGAEPKVDPFSTRIMRELERTAPRTQPMEGTVSLTAARVAILEEDGNEVFGARSLTAVVDMNALGRGGTLVHSARIRGLRADLVRQGAEGPWNYEGPLAGFFEEKEDDGRAVPLDLRDIVVLDGDARVAMGGDVYHFASLSATLPHVAIRPDAPGPVVQIAQLNTLATMDTITRLPIAVRNTTLRVGDRVLGFDVGNAEIGETRVAAVEGEWRLDEGIAGFDATGRVEHLRFADVQWIAPTLPDTGTASFHFSTEPVGGTRLRIALSELEALSGRSAIRGSLVAVVGGEARPEIGEIDLRLDPLDLELVRPFVDSLPYGGTIAGSITGSGADLRFDVVATLTTPGVSGSFETGLVGRVALGPETFELRELVATLDEVPLRALAPLAPGLPVRGVISGRVALTGPPGRAPLDVDIALELGNGSATMVGRLDLTGAVPSYDLTGTIAGVRLAALIDRPVPPVALTARYSVNGAGTGLESANARFSIFGRFTGWRTDPQDTLIFRGALRNGLLAVDTLNASIGSASATAAGTWDLGTGGAVGIRYDVEFADLAPFAAYLPMLPDSGPVSGAIRSRGTLAGTLANPAIDGTASGRSVRFGDWSATEFEATFAYTAREATPNVRLELIATGVATPTDIAMDRANLDFTLANRRFTIDFEGERTRGGPLELQAEGTLETEGLNTMLLQNLALDVQDERWALADTTRVQWGAGGIRVNNLVVQDVNGTGRIAVDGSIDFDGASNLDATVTRLPLGDVLPLLGIRRPVTGILTARAQLRGSGTSPDITIDVEAVDGAIEGVPYTRIGGVVRYQNGAARTDLTATLVGGGMLDIDGEIPMRVALSGTPSFELLETAPLRLTMVADSLPLAPFGTMSPLVRDMEGLIEGHVAIEGTVAEPRLAGQAALLGGAMTIPELNQRFEQITASVLLEGRRMVVRSFEAQSRGSGWVRGEGAVVFEDLTNPVADLTVRLDEFSPLGIRDMDDVQMSGTVQVGGPLFGRLVVTGDVRMEDGGVPLYSFGQRTQLIAELEELTAARGTLGTFGTPGAESEQTEPFMERIVLDGVSVNVGQGVWFVTDRIRARLSGDLTVYRDLYKEQNELRVFGSLTGDQGTFTLEAGPIVRRFQIIEASVRFFGTPEPDPAISATASRVVIDASGRRTEILVRVEGTVTAPRLSLATPEGTAIPESELLNVLVFGGQNASIGASSTLLGQDAFLPGAGLVENVFFSGLADWASVELEEALVGDLGLEVDYIQLRTPPGVFAAPQVVVGKEVTDDVFLTVETGVSVLFSEWAATAEWRIDREWSVELALRPLTEQRFLLGVPLRSTFQSSVNRQISLDVRRRWTY